MEALSGGVVLAIVFFLLLLAILWIILPFAVFGIKNRLDTIIKVADKASERLERIERQLRAMNAGEYPGQAHTPPKIKVEMVSEKTPDGGQTWPTR